MIESMFEQYDLRGLSLPNRWVVAPMTRKQSPGKVPTDAVAEYYRRRAAGGVGLIITEGTLVDHPLASSEDTIPQITPDTVTAWRTVVEKVHEEGARILVQLWHQGPIARPGISATPLVEDGVEVVQKADSQQEQLLADAFVGGAVSAKAAGFDGVEFHGAHGYLLDSFLRAGRLDYFCDLVRETRNQVGPELLLALRFSQWTVRDHSARQFDTPQHLERVLLGLREAGIDVFHASTSFLAARIRRERSQSGRLDPQDYRGSNHHRWKHRLEHEPILWRWSGECRRTATKIRSGEFDMAAIGRPLISDPEWCDKVRDGRTDAILDYTKEANETYP